MLRLVWYFGWPPAALATHLCSPSIICELQAVPIVVKGNTVEPGDPVPLFQPRIVTGPTSAYRAQYDVAKDGRFLVNVTAEDTTTSPITLLMNRSHLAK